jgi:dihydroorotase
VKVLLQSPLILDKRSGFHKKKKNVLIQGGRIQEIGDKNYSADKVIDADGMILSPGWIDVGTVTGEPGFEHKEDTDSLSKAAAAGGFTQLAVFPNTNPAIQTKSDITHLTRKNESRLVQLIPIASVTRNNEGTDLTEMLDLNDAGAMAFSDGLKTITNTDIFLKALQYIKKFDGVLIDHAQDQWLDMFGQMNESPTSAALGLKGMPKLSEEVAASRNLKLLSYSEGRLHLARVSSPKVLDLIRTAKKKGSNITCDIASYQAILNDSLLTEFDTNYKVNPPLREKSDNDSLIKGLKEGTIDIICTGHSPQDEESKVVEFDHSEFGIINLQTFASHLVILSESVEWEDLIDKVSINPASMLSLSLPKIEEEEKANLTLINPNEEWTFDEKSNFSKSKNSPWIGKKLMGRAVAVFNNGKQWIDV